MTGKPMKFCLRPLTKQKGKLPSFQKQPPHSNPLHRLHFFHRLPCWQTQHLSFLHRQFQWILQPQFLTLHRHPKSRCMPLHRQPRCSHLCLRRALHPYMYRQSQYYFLFMRHTRKPRHLHQQSRFSTLFVRHPHQSDGPTKLARCKQPRKSPSSLLLFYQQPRHPLNILKR